MDVVIHKLGVIQHDVVAEFGLLPLMIITIAVQGYSSTDD